MVAQKQSWDCKGMDTMFNVIKKQPINTKMVMPSHLPNPALAGAMPLACCCFCYPPDPWRPALMERLCQALPEDRQSVVLVAREPCNEGQMSGNGHRDSETERQQSIFQQRECQNSASQMSVVWLCKYKILSSVG